MVKIYFVCMGNYYRSRLAEELALHYAKSYGVDIDADSGGLSRIPNPNNVGTIAKATLRYLEQKQVQTKNVGRFPKNCSAEEVYSADIVVLTDEAEQAYLFAEQFPDYKGQLIGWSAHDLQYDLLMDTPQLIDKHVEQLIKSLSQK